MLHSICDVQKLEIGSFERLFKPFSAEYGHRSLEVVSEHDNGELRLNLGYGFE